MPRKRKTPKEGSSAQGQPSELRVHGQQQRHGQSEQTEHGQTSQPQPHLQQSHQRHVQTVSQEGLLQGSPGSLQRLEQPQQTLEAAQGREYIQSLQHQQGCGPPLPYHGQAAKGKGRVGEAQGTRPVSGLSIGSYVPVATVGPSIPDLRQAVLSHATPYQQAFVGADIGHQTLPLGRPSLLPPESAGPPLEEHFQNITLQASKPEVAGPSQVQAPPISSKKLVFPRRPGKGQTGIKCLVKANHFITELPEKDLHQYDVSYFPA